MARLLANAAKFSPQSAVLDVALTWFPRQGQFSMRDCGPGITPAFRACVFQKFVREHATGTRQKCGTGCGLSILHAIIESHHDRIYFISEPATVPNSIMTCR